jgi:hypothetical protein
MQNSNDLGGTDSASLLSGQNPQNPGTSSGGASQAADFQNPVQADTLNKTTAENLQVETTGQPAGARDTVPDPPMNRDSLVAGIVILLVLAAVFSFIYYYAKRLRRGRVSEDTVLDQSPFVDPTAEHVHAAKARKAGVPSSAKSSNIARKKKRKSPPGRRKK